MIQKILEALNKAKSDGIDVNSQINAIIIPSNLLDEFKKEYETHLINNVDEKKWHLFNFEILISADGEKIRFGKVY